MLRIAVSLSMMYIFLTVAHARAVTFGNISSGKTNFYGGEKRIGPSLTYLLKKDVFGHCGLYQYDTELKQKNYRQTEEYRQKLGEMQEARSKMLAQKWLFRGECSDVFFVPGFISRYNLKRQGMSFTIGQRESVKATVQFGDVYFDFLPLDNSGSNSGIVNQLFLSMDERTGTMVESLGDNLDFAIVFGLKDTDGIIAAKCPATLYLVDRNTDEVVFEKTFPCRSAVIKRSPKR